jgi:hypothetical protein
MTYIYIYIKVVYINNNKLETRKKKKEEGGDQIVQFNQA